MNKLYFLTLHYNYRSKVLKNCNFHYTFYYNSSLVTLVNLMKFSIYNKKIKNYDIYFSYTLFNNLLKHLKNN